MVNTVAQAYTRFVDPLSRAVSCITRDILLASPPNSRGVQALTLSSAGLCKLKAKRGLFFDLKINFAMIKDDRAEEGPWRASTKAYAYQISDNREQEVMSFHWHPFIDPKYPHLHLGAGSFVADFLTKAHIPMGRVSLEEVVRFLISDLGTEPLKQNWGSVLRYSQSKFEKFRTWPK